MTRFDGRGRWRGALAGGLVLLALGCGGRPPDAPEAPVAELREAARAAADVEARRKILDRVAGARARWIHDRSLRALEAELRADLGDWPGALDLALPVGGVGEALVEPARIRPWIEAADAWERWLPFAEAAGHDRLDAASAHHADWLRARAATAPDDALDRALAALDVRPGDPHLLAAAAAAAARARQWSVALLSASRALDEAERAGVEVPSPARSILAMALAVRDPPLAPAAFEAARVEALPAARRAEARFLLRHARPRQAAQAIGQWLADHPLDAESAELAARLDGIVERVEGEARVAR